MSDDQLQSHLKENIVPHQLILLNVMNEIRAGNSRRDYENVATQQEAMQQNLTTVQAVTTGHDWVLRSHNQRITSLEKEKKTSKRGGE